MQTQQAGRAREARTTEESQSNRPNHSLQAGELQLQRLSALPLVPVAAAQVPDCQAP